MNEAKNLEKKIVTSYTFFHIMFTKILAEIIELLTSRFLGRYNLDINLIFYERIQWMG